MNNETAHLKEASTADLLRFGSAGVIAFIYLFISNPKEATFLAQVTGVLGFPLILIVSGSLIYFIYRPLIFDLVLRRYFNKLKDGRDHYCGQLSARYGIDLSAARQLWRVLQERTLAERSRHWEVRASGIHMTFVAAILAVPFAFICFAGREWTAGITLLAFGSLCCLAGLLHGRIYETEEFNRLRAIPVAKVKEIVDAFSTMFEASVSDQPKV